MRQSPSFTTERNHPQETQNGQLLTDSDQSSEFLDLSQNWANLDKAQRIAKCFEDEFMMSIID